MAENSNIEWTDHTFNPWIGCTKVSPGCLHCYAETLMDTRYGRVKWGKGQPRQRTSAANWKLPLRWDNQAAQDAHSYSVEVGAHFTEADEMMEEPHRPRVFCASLADWLDDEVPVDWLADLLDLIRRTPNLDWLLLTKRPENWADQLGRVVNDLARRGRWNDDTLWIAAWMQGEPPANVWIGTTVEDQPRANDRIPALLKIPARVRFLSCEPLLTAVDVASWGWRNTLPTDARIHWVICGGESGPGARPMLVEWADDLRRQCEDAGVAFFMKQLGAHVGTTNANAHDWPEHVEFREVPGTPQFAGARVILNGKKGGDFEEFPTELQVRQFPEVRL